jgi:hypothetical protein
VTVTPKTVTFSVKTPVTASCSIPSGQFFFWQQPVQQLFQFDSRLVASALLAATEFFVTFVESSHSHYFLTTFVQRRFMPRNASMSNGIIPTTLPLLLWPPQLHGVFLSRGYSIETSFPVRGTGAARVRILS